MNTLIKLTEEDIVYFIGIGVVILFSIAFIGIASFYYYAKKRNVLGKLDDVDINKEIDDSVSIYTKKGKTEKDFYRNYLLRKKRKKDFNKISSIFFYVIYLFIFIAIGFTYSVKHTTDSPIWFNNQAMLIIQTKSMETANSSNKYLFDENGKTNSEDRIKRYSFITITKQKRVMNAIQVNDVCAFKMYDNTSKKNIIIVHRLIEITQDENGTNLYTFRGDANSSSLVNETKITKDKIIGVYKSSIYQGAKNYGFGKFMIYLQSNVGIIMFATAFFILILYTVLVDKVFELYDIRYDQIVEERYSKYKRIRKIKRIK